MNGTCASLRTGETREEPEEPGVRTNPTVFGSRVAIGTAAFVVIGVLIIAGAAAVVIELVGNHPASTTTTRGPVTARAMAIDPKGNYVTNATLRLGDEMRLSVTVTNGTEPIAVHMVFNGNVYPDLPWNVNATHYNFIIDSGPADAADVGVNAVYAVVSFQDGGLVQSNGVTITVTH